MKRIVKVIGSVVIAVAAAIALALGERKLNRVMHPDVQAASYAGGDEAIRRGQYLFETRGCAEWRRVTMKWIGCAPSVTG